MAKHDESNVFINFYRADVLGGGFVDNLEKALKRDGFNVFADALIDGIEDSRIALVVFSSRYTESRRCLDELVKIKEGMEEGKIMVIPIFYKLDISAVKGLEGGLNLFNPAMRDFELEQLKIWKEALDSVSCMMGFQLHKNSDESKFITRIVKDVMRMLTQMSMVENISKSHDRLDEEKNDDFVNSSKSDENPKDVLESVQGEAGLCGKSISHDNFLGDIQNSEEKKQGKVSNSSTMVTYKPPPEPKVFINFQGSDLRDGFVGELVEALKRVGFNVDIDNDELPLGDITELHYKSINESRIAVVIFSNSYTESTWCLDELVKIKKRMDEGKLLIIPIFYKVKQLQVKQLQGNFGVRLWNLWRINREHRIIRWKEALEYVGGMMGFQFEEDCDERKFITPIVKEVMVKISLQGRKNPSFFPSTGGGESIELSTGKGENLDTYLNKHPLFGIKLRMEQLEQKLEFDYDVTRIIGVVGMPGIGKTTLAMMLHKKWTYNFVRCMPLLGIRKKSKDYEPVWLRKTILQVLLEGKIPVINNETTHESVKDILLQTKVFIVLDDVSDKKQLDFLLGNLDWIKKGSKIIITTSDQSLLKGFADDTYVVPQLNDKEAFQLFTYHAFDDKICCPTQTFLMLSRKFVDYARGHPQTLILLGTELHGKDEAHWEHRLGTITDCYNTRIQDVWRFSIDQLNEQQKDVFLDIVYFFKSEDEYFVRSLLSSGDPDTTDSVSELRDLTDKFLITISDGRVEMNDLLYNFSKGLGFPLRHRLWNYKDIYMREEMNETEANNVRGIFLDMSEVTESIPLETMTFINMRNLRYLKIYDSSWPQQCKDDSKLDLPDGLAFPLEEIRYLHWVKFPLKELPSDFRPENLVDLRLPYSKTERIWEGVKDTPRLKWVDLRHSSKLLNLSALSKAENLQRLILEGCTLLDELPVEIQDMKSLVFLNLRGCIRLRSLTEMNLVSLQTLILSDCSNLKEFQLISESVEFLYLDGTAIKELPPSIQKLQRLVVLNLKNCKMLECLPKCLGELKALEELILSGCSRLKNLLNVRESMKHLQSLLIDSIGAKEMLNILSIPTSKGQTSANMFLHGPSGWPRGADEVSSLRRLSLSGNDFVSLQTDIWKLYNLNWLDVKECKMLGSIPILPPKLQYFDAHGCDSLDWNQ